jgi:hypothetical protein
MPAAAVAAGLARVRLAQVVQAVVAMAVPLPQNPVTMERQIEVAVVVVLDLAHQAVLMAAAAVPVLSLLLIQTHLRMPFPQLDHRHSQTQVETKFTNGQEAGV